jgi:hypothetical protein
VFVYGDRQTIEQSQSVRRSIAALLDKVAEAQSGAARHALLVRAFVRMGELAQGVADAEFERRGCDRRSHAQDRCGELLVALARLVDQSWRQVPHRIEQVGHIKQQLAALDCPFSIRVKRAEGFAHYALYPETYLEAARRSGLGPETRVIGIRSIGFGLAALVSAALDAAPPTSLRPVGHPFQRRIAAAPELAAEFASAPAVHFAIVDEGPGLSGSSFAAVAEWLERNGVSTHRIHFFPSHSNGPGPETQPVIRQRWQDTAQHHVDLQDASVGAASVLDRIQHSLRELLGPLDGRLTDISGGAWRHIHNSRSDPLPPCDPRLERRKFMARARGESWLVKFAGLDEGGALKLQRAAALARTGFSPEPAGLCYGFLVERWLDSVPLDRRRISRSSLLRQIGAYLGFRAHSFTAGATGASLEELREMACCNTREALGEPAADVLAARLRHAGDLQEQVRPAHVDGRLHAWEWLTTDNGRLVKTDAIDHSCGHDLVGCQDIAWDVVGATVEHSLDNVEQGQLCDQVARSRGRPVEPKLVQLLTPCYLAFQLGLWTQAAIATGGGEATGQRSCAARYRDLLATWISGQVAV